MFSSIYQVSWSTDSALFHISNSMLQDLQSQVVTTGTVLVRPIMFGCYRSVPCRARATNDHLYDLQCAPLKCAFVVLTASPIVDYNRIFWRLSKVIQLSWVYLPLCKIDRNLDQSPLMIFTLLMFVCYATAMTVRYEIAALCNFVVTNGRRWNGGVDIISCNMPFKLIL